MSDKPIAQKLAIKPGQKVLLVNPPKGYKAGIGDLPAGARVVSKPDGVVDVIQVFCDSRADLEQQLPKLKTQLDSRGMIWVTYHKGTSRIKTDISGDTIAAYARTIGLQPVAMIAVDDDWSALRLKVV